MTEHDLVARLLKLLKAELPREAVLFKHANYVTAGIPDLTVTMNGKTSWWEVKHATPKVTGTGVQHLTARRLAAAGDCWYIVYRSPTDKDGSNAAMTCLVRPQDIGENGYFKMVDDAHQCYGYDHRFVLAFIKKVHGVQ